jgi:hypothetical protein
MTETTSGCDASTCRPLIMQNKSSARKPCVCSHLKMDCCAQYRRRKLRPVVPKSRRSRNAEGVGGAQVQSPATPRPVLRPIPRGPADFRREDTERRAGLPSGSERLAILLHDSQPAYDLLFHFRIVGLTVAHLASRSRAAHHPSAVSSASAVPSESPRPWTFPLQSALRSSPYKEHLHLA